MKRLKKLLGKYRTKILMSWYALFFYHFQLKEADILVDSKNGKDLGSNMLRIVEELVQNPEYKKYKIFVACNKDRKTLMRKMIARYHLKKVHLIREGGFRYARIIGRARYLFTDTSFPLWFCKKDGQIITNTWHGTPLKAMGKDVENRSFDMGNVQKSHLIADYLIYPSDYMKDIMASAYYLDNLYQGKILCSGYPRNSVFFDAEKGRRLRKDLGLEEKRVYGYMPTWRGTLKKSDLSMMVNQVEYYFDYLDKRLSEDEIFYVRLHPFVANTIDYSQYRQIKPFPEEYEPYDILNACDCMVTDYSSVLFDYANSGKKIVLFVYDKELYMDERGCYVSLDSLPFPQVRRVDELLCEIRSPKEYDDREFREKFCRYDEENAARKLCAHIIKQENIYPEMRSAGNGKENVLIYSGALAKNGLTTALINLLENVDKTKRNYYVTFTSNELRKDPSRVRLLPEGVGIAPIASITGGTFGEELAMKRYFNKNKETVGILKKVDRFYARVYKRAFGNCDFSHVVHYSGYVKEITNLLLNASVRRKTIFVHNNMIEEIATRNNQHELTLRRAYHDYDRVAIVTEDMYDPTLELGNNQENICIVNNCHDYRTVLEKAEKKIALDKETVSSISEKKLKEILESDAVKIITIGRFSPEKGHDMLLQAFERYYQEYPDSYLILIGGHGVLFDETCAKAQSLTAAEHIIILKSVSNPMPILKKCDLFVLSSRYEGLGLVLLEADTVGVPVVSTDILGPRGFLREHGGYLVSADVDGVYSGMKAFSEGNVSVMNVDYEAYNRHCVQQFEKLFEGEER